MSTGTLRGHEARSLVTPFDAQDLQGLANALVQRGGAMVLGEPAGIQRLTTFVLARALGEDINREPLKPAGASEIRQASAAFNAMQARLVRYIEDRTRVLAALETFFAPPTSTGSVAPMEATGSLDEVAITSIRERLLGLAELAHGRRLARRRRRGHAPGCRRGRRGGPGRR